VFFLNFFKLFLLTQKPKSDILFSNRGACDSRLRGSNPTSTLEPDLGNANVGKISFVFFGIPLGCVFFVVITPKVQTQTSKF